MKPPDNTEIKSAAEMIQHIGQKSIQDLMIEYGTQFVRLTLKIASEKAVADVSQNSTTNYCVVKPDSILNLESEILKLIK